VTARDGNPKLNGAPSTFFYPEKVEMEKVDLDGFFPPGTQKVDWGAAGQTVQCPAEIGLEAGACGGDASIPWDERGHRKKGSLGDRVKRDKHSGYGVGTVRRDAVFW
jgi:hypothetical protein